MVLTPKITTEDVRLTLNGTLTGSTYYFWDQSFSSGSVLAQINLANYYMYNMLGKSTMDSTDEVTSYIVKTAQLEYSCFRLLVVLSGGVIIDGFNWEAGVKVENPKMLEAYKNLTDGFKSSYILLISQIQPIAIIEETEMPIWHYTTRSIM